MSQSLVKWPERCWEADYVVKDGRADLMWFSRPVRDEDRARRAEVTAKLNAVDISER